MRVVVTRIGPDGAVRRRMVDTAASSGAGQWEELITRALAAPPPYRPVPGGRSTISASMTRLYWSPSTTCSGRCMTLSPPCSPSARRHSELVTGRPARAFLADVSRRGQDSGSACCKNRRSVRQGREGSAVVGVPDEMTCARLRLRQVQRSSSPVDLVRTTAAGSAGESLRRSHRRGESSATSWPRRLRSRSRQDLSPRR